MPSQSSLFRVCTFMKRDPRSLFTKIPKGDVCTHATSCRKTTAALQILSPSGKRQRLHLQSLTLKETGKVPKIATSLS